MILNFGLSTNSTCVGCRIFADNSFIKGVFCKVVLNSTTCIIRGMSMRSLIFDPDVFIDRMDFDLDGFHFDTTS